MCIGRTVRMATRLPKNTQLAVEVRLKRPTQFGTRLVMHRAACEGIVRKCAAQAESRFTKTVNRRFLAFFSLTA